MKLVAVIVNYKTPEMTLDAARAAIGQLRVIDGEWCLVIVDNDSRDGSYETLKSNVKKNIDSGDEEWKKVSVMESDHNGGYGAGNNFAIRKYLSKENAPDYFYILNSDAFPEENSIALLISHLNRNPETGIAGSYIHGVDGEPHVTAFRFPSVYSEVLEGSGGFGWLNRILDNYVVPMGIPSSTLKVDWLAGASMLIRRELLEQIGLFDEKYFLYFEETDLCKRAKRSGWNTVYVRESSVSHVGSVSTGMKKWQRIPDYWLDSRKHYFTKNHGSAYYYLATIGRILGGLLHWVKVMFSKRRSSQPNGFTFDLTVHTFRKLFK